MAAARQLYEAAGAWPELLSLCALQGDFMSVRNYMHSVSLPARAMMQHRHSVHHCDAESQSMNAPVLAESNTTSIGIAELIFWMTNHWPLLDCPGGQRGHAAGEGAAGSG